MFLKTSICNVSSMPLGTTTSRHTIFRGRTFNCRCKFNEICIWVSPWMTSKINPSHMKIRWKGPYIEIVTWTLAVCAWMSRGCVKCYKYYNEKLVCYVNIAMLPIHKKAPPTIIWCNTDETDWENDMWVMYVPTQHICPGPYSWGIFDDQT